MFWTRSLLESLFLLNVKGAKVQTALHLSSSCSRIFLLFRRITGLSVYFSLMNLRISSLCNTLINALILRYLCQQVLQRLSLAYGELVFKRLNLSLVVYRLKFEVKSFTASLHIVFVKLILTISGAISVLIWMFFGFSAMSLNPAIYRVHHLLISINPAFIEEAETSYFSGVC